MGTGAVGLKSPEQVAEDMAQNARDAAQYPQPKSVAETRARAKEAWEKSDGIMSGIVNWGKEYVTSPADTASIIGESVPASGAMLAAGAAGTAVGSTGGPIAGVMAGSAAGGAASGAVEFGSAMRSFLTEKGVDPTDPAQLQKAWANPELMAEAKIYAVKRGVSVGLFDALSFGLGGKLLGPVSRVAGKGTVGKVAGGATELGVQAGLAASGESTAQLATDGEIKDPMAVLEEAFSEGITGVGEVALGKPKAPAVPPATPAVDPAAPAAVDPAAPVVDPAVPVQQPDPNTPQTVEPAVMPCPTPSSRPAYQGGALPHAPS